MKIAILIPCYNEEKTVGKVIADFKKNIPQADIYVYDNNSKDKTFEVAQLAGATVKKEEKQGKGNVVRSMFRDINADYYLLVDGDDTYPAESAQALLAFISNGVDMVIGDRLSNGMYAKENKRSFHNFGNNLVLFLINRLYGVKLKDIMSGYRVFSRRFVNLYPVLCEGFQLETDLTIFALSHKLKVVEVPVAYRDRPVGSESKLNTYSDGFKVILTIFNLYRYFYPLKYFSFMAGVLTIAGLVIGTPVTIEFFETQYITKIPSAVLASGLIILAFVTFFSGLILDSINKIDQENFEREYKKNKY